MAIMKEIISVIAVFLTFAAYVPYYRSILKGKTHPHIYTWALWGLVTVLIVALQIKGGAGAASLVTIAGGLLCLGVIILSLKSGKKDITKSDKVVAILSLAAIVSWLIADQPVLSVILIISSDMFAFIPTVRKSWRNPRSESLLFYVTNLVRFSVWRLLQLKHIHFCLQPGSLPGWWVTHCFH